MTDKRWAVAKSAVTVALWLICTTVYDAAHAAITLQSNTASVDISETWKGRRNNPRWTWIGESSQSCSMTFDNDGTYIDLTGLYVVVKVARDEPDGRTAYIALSPSDVTIDGSNITFTVANTNVPASGSYDLDVWCYDSATTNQSTTLAQGRVTVVKSLYDGSEDSFPWPSTANLTDYVEKSILTTAGDIAYRNGTTWTRLAAGTTNQFLRGGTTPAWAVPAGAGDITGVTAGSGLSGGGASGTVTLAVTNSPYLGGFVAASWATDAEVGVATAAVYLAATTYADSNDSTNDTVAWSEISGIVGTGAQQVAQGSHAHTGVYQPADAQLTEWAAVSTSAYYTATQADAADDNTTYTAGSGLTLAGTTFSLTDGSSQASVNNSGGNVIQDVTLDTYGRITSLGSVDLDSRYLELDGTGTMTGDADIGTNNLTNVKKVFLDGSQYIASYAYADLDPQIDGERFYQYGTYNGSNLYVTASGDYYLWWDGATAWVVEDVPGGYNSYWTSGGGITGIFVPGGTQTANVTIAASAVSDETIEAIDAYQWGLAYTLRTTLNALNGLVTCNGSGTYSATTIGTGAAQVAAGNHTHTGVYQPADDDLTDLADGSLSGSKVGSGIAGANITTGSVGADQIAATTVTPGSYTAADITVDADGRITAAANGSGAATNATLLTYSGTNVTTAALDTGDFGWDGTNLTVTATGASTLSALTDVSLGGTISTGAVLRYTGSAWTNCNACPYFFAYGSADQDALTDSSYVVAQLNAEVEDVYGMFNTTTYTFTVPAGWGGLWELEACAAIEEMTDGKYAEVVVDCSVAADGADRRYASGTQVLFPLLKVTRRLAVGETAQMKVRHNNGNTNPDLAFSTWGAGNSYFSARYVGP